MVVTAATALLLGRQGYSAGPIILRCMMFVAEGLLLCTCSARMSTALRRAAGREQWHRRLTETAAEGIQVADEDGVIAWANPRMSEILGYSLSEIVGRKTEDFLFPEDVPFERIRIGSRRYGVPEQFDRRLRRKDGSEAWVLVSGNSFRSEQGAFEAGLSSGMLLMMTDITERKNAEQALRRSEARFRGLFENVLEGVYQSTPDGRILAANPMLLRMLGLESEAELNDVNIASDLYCDPNVRRQLVDRLELDGSFQNVEYDLRRRDGRIVRVCENARVVRGDDGRVLYFEGTLTDVTEKKEIEERLRIVQEAEAGGRMAGAVAQDFGNALTAISGYSRLILDDLPESHALHPIAAELLRSVESASEMIRQVAAFGQRRTAYSATVDLNRLLLRVGDTLRRIAGSEVAVTILAAPGPLLVNADPVHLEQIAVSLATGARRAILGSGAMEVKAEISGCFASLSMRCTGCPDQAPHFGLSTIQAIVSQYGGTVIEESSPGSKVVSILLPEAQ